MRRDRFCGMKKRRIRAIVSLFMAAAMLLSAVGTGTMAAEAEAYGGTGTESAPYQIATAEQLAALAAEVNGGDTYEGKYFELTADIDLSTVCGADIGGSEVSWTPIGNFRYDESNREVGYKFKGTFDGGSHEIAGFYINAPSGEYQGLFGCLGEGGTIKNLSVCGTVSGGEHVGGVCGDNYGTIESCSNACETTAMFHVGGVCGYNCSTGTLENCYNTGAVRTTGGFAGGICGTNSGGSIIRCHNTGAVCYDGNIGNIGDNNGFGGVCGFNAGPIVNCYNTGAVSGDGHVGGISGYNHASATNCYNTGTVTGNVNVGGVCGEDDTSQWYCPPVNCYYLDTCCASGDGAATAKDAEAFALGKVARLLQGEQAEQVWGQTVGSSYPELTGDPTKAVYKVTFTVDKAEYAVKYGNPTGLSVLPDEPTKDGYIFSKWMMNVSDKEHVGLDEFTQATPLSKDIIVTAQWTSGSTTPTTDPTDTPVQPPYTPPVQPTDPSDTPTDPTDDPSDPSEDPTDPSTDPSDTPTDDPSDPSAEGPTIPSTDPATNPSASVDASKKPFFGTSVKWKGASITLSWTKVAGADGYHVFATQCGKDMSQKTLNKAIKGSKTSATLTKIGGKTISAKKTYKIRIRAWKYVGKKKVYMRSTLTAHMVGASNKTYTNAKKLTSAKSSYTLKKGKSATLRIKTTKQSSKKKLLSTKHCAYIRYYSDNKKIATVTSKGKVTAKAKGTCYVYAVAQNGVKTKVKVTVK